MEVGYMNLVHEYDQWHKTVFEADPTHADESSPWYRLVFEHLVPLEGKDVLEVGCGRGGFALQLAAQGATVWGTDFSSSALEIAGLTAKRRGAGKGALNFVVADAQRLPFADDSFDIVVSCEMIEHVPNPLAATREMARVCRPGGLLYLTTPNYLNLIGFYELYAAVLKKKKHSEFAQPLDLHYVFFQTRSLLRKSGWQIVASDGTIHQVPLPGRNPVTIPIFERNRTLRRLLAPLALHYLLIGRKQGSPA
jgi:ubiquinone/menaquinone biosynthesis C-methylase UbiE